MGQYRVHLNLAPSGGRRLAYGEVVEIADEEIGPYQQFIDRRWLTPYVPPGYVAPVAVPDDEVEDAPIVDVESTVDAPAEPEAPAE